MTDECEHHWVPILNGTVIWCTECNAQREWEVAGDEVRYPAWTERDPITGEVPA